MKMDRNAQQMKDWCKCVTTVQQRTDELSLLPQQQLGAEAFEELCTALEKLQVAEEELKVQEELASARTRVEAERQRYRDFFESAPDAYLVSDVAGTIREANCAAAGLFNVERKFLIGKPLINYILHAERQAFRSKLNQLCKKNLRQEWELRVCPCQGAAFDAALSLSTVHDAEGKLVALRWLLRDITLRKQTEAALQERTSLLQQALDFEAMLKRITDKVRDSLDENQVLQTAVQELSLVPGVSCCNTALYNLDQGISTISCEYATSIPAEQVRVVQIANLPEIYQQLFAGQYFQFCSIIPNPIRGRVALLVCPIFDDQGVLGDLCLINQQEHVFNELEIRLVQQVANQCAIAIRQARLYQASLAQVKELEKLNYLKDDFLSTVSHELRTPVSNMKIAIHMLKNAVEGKDRNRYLQILENECTREIELINDLLDLQHLEANSYLIARDIISLQDWLPSIIESFRLRMQERQQLLRVELPPLLQSLIADRTSLGRVLVELLNNAYKYTHSGGEIVLRVCQDKECWQKELPKPPNLCPECSDRSGNPQVASQGNETVITFTISNEASIPDSELPRIFDKLYRIPKSDPWKQGGTGLGLALVQKLVTQMSGTIQAESSRGWTTFTVQLPNCLD